MMEHIMEMEYGKFTFNLNKQGVAKLTIFQRYEDDKVIVHKGGD